MLICRSQLGSLHYESLICLSNRSLNVAHMAYGIQFRQLFFVCTYNEISSLIIFSQIEKLNDSFQILKEKTCQRVQQLMSLMFDKQKF